MWVCRICIHGRKMYDISDLGLFSWQIWSQTHHHNRHPLCVSLVYFLLCSSEFWTELHFKARAHIHSLFQATIVWNFLLGGWWFWQHNFWYWIWLQYKFLGGSTYAFSAWKLQWHSWNCKGKNLNNCPNHLSSLVFNPPTMHMWSFWTKIYQGFSSLLVQIP